jgi:hypothetical protein
MQLSRGDLLIHLSEHHGDASPGTTRFCSMHGIAAFHAELIGKNYRNNPAGTGKAGMGARSDGQRPLRQPPPLLRAAARLIAGRRAPARRHSAAAGAY